MAIRSKKREDKWKRMLIGTVLALIMLGSVIALLFDKISSFP